MHKGIQTTEELVVLATVRVPWGVPLDKAIEAHRDRTGYGGGCILYFDPAPQPRASDYASDRVFDGTRPMSAARVAKLRARHSR